MSQANKEIMGFDCVISYYKNDGSLEDDRLDVYISSSCEMDEGSGCDSFGVDDDAIFCYLGSSRLKPGNYQNEFYIHSCQAVYSA